MGLLIILGILFGIWLIGKFISASAADKGHQNTANLGKNISTTANVGMNLVGWVIIFIVGFIIGIIIFI